jgi:hypothetical protein
MNASIPVYNADGSLYAWASEQRFARLQSAGLVARTVRRRKGRISRAILFLRPGEPKPVSANSVTGTRYSFKELLKHGPAWELKHLGGNRDEKTYAPPETKVIFLQVVNHCRVK